jgi:hypothetical protein
MTKSMIYKTDNIKGLNVRSLDKIGFKDLILLILLIANSITNIAFFDRKNVQLMTMLFFGFYFLYKYRRFDSIIYKILIYAFLVQLFSMIRFNEVRLDRFLSLGLLYTRLLIPYFILRLGGEGFLLKFEKFSFYLILIGLPLFFLVHHFPGVESFLSKFDINSIEEQRRAGGWNIFVFVYSGWAGYRFCGYAYEPGGMALMITISWVIYIIFYGTKFNYRVFIYAFAMMLTFSTTGYMALLALIIFYSYIKIKAKNVVKFSIYLIFIIVGFSLVYKQDFISKKISAYIERDKEIRLSSGGYEQSEYQFAGRLGAIYVAIKNVEKWPFGHGTVSGGRIKSRWGGVLDGANGVAQFFTVWGIFGGIFLIYSIFLLVKRFHSERYLIGRILLLLALILVFASNSIGGRAITYVLILYPYLYLVKTPLRSTVSSLVTPPLRAKLRQDNSFNNNTIKQF